MKYRFFGITAMLLIISIVHFFRMAPDGIDRNVEYVNVAVMVALSVLIIFQVIRIIRDKKKQL